jgi:hypothetical protein
MAPSLSAMGMASCRAATSRRAKVDKYRELRAGLDALFGIFDN